MAALTQVSTPYEDIGEAAGGVIQRHGEDVHDDSDGSQ